jgi:hypothetical protein
MSNGGRLSGPENERTTTMSLRKTLATLAAALCIGAAAASPALAVNEDLSGRPESLHPDGELGYYIWADEDGIHLRTTGPGPRHIFHAVLMTDGRFEDVRFSRAEAADALIVHPNRHVLEARFETWGAIDGVDFRIDGGSALRLALRRDGELVPTSEIFLGADGSQPEDNPFVVYR